MAGCGTTSNIAKVQDKISQFCLKNVLPCGMQLLPKQLTGTSRAMSLTGCYYHYRPYRPGETIHRMSLEALPALSGAPPRPLLPVARLGAPRICERHHQSSSKKTSAGLKAFLKGSPTHKLRPNPLLLQFRHLCLQP